MSDWNTDFLNQYKGGGGPRNAPAGLQQAGSAGYQYGAHGGGTPQGAQSPWDTSFLGKYTYERGFTPMAQSWYSGANREDVTNGWDTNFFNRMYEQNQKFGEQGRLATQFESEHATGVVTWDHLSSDKEKKFEFGDVYDNGKKVGNVFEQFDTHTANVMMADLMFDRTTKAHYFEDTKIDPTNGRILSDGGLGKAVQQARHENNDELGKVLRAKDFMADTEKQEKELEEKAWWDPTVILGGAAGGALTGGAAGTVVAGPVGTAVGAIVGGIAGGVGAWMNQDAITEEAARAYEITSMANRRYGTAAGIASGVEQWAGLGARAFAPLSNITRGLEDVSQGTVGDGDAEFFATDKTGERKAGWGVQKLDIAASVADSFIQFASPLGISLYTAQMAGTIGGETASLALTGGRQFNYSEGAFNNIFKDDDGNIDFSSAAAGIGKVGIDVVQVGMVRGLAGKALAAQGEAGLAAAARTGLGGLRGRLPTRLGGWTAEQRVALETGARPVEAAGSKFVVTAEGEVVGPARRTLSLLAPSDMLKSVSTSAIARRAAAVKGGAYTVDDFYKVAHSMAMGERKIQSTIVNAMGEGFEEGVQNVFENHAVGNSQDGHEIWNAIQYGAAMGAGMGLGMALQTPSADARMRGQAQFMDPNLTDAQWKRLSPEEKRARAHQSRVVKEMQDAVGKRIIAEQEYNQTAGMGGVFKVRDAVHLSQLEKDLKKGSEVRTDAALTITLMNDTGQIRPDGTMQDEAMPNYGVVTSGVQMRANLDNTHKGLEIAEETYRRELAELATQDQADPDVVAKTAELTDKIASMDRIQQWALRINPFIDEHLTRILGYVESGDAAATTSEATSLNVMLRQAFNQEIARLTDRTTGTVHDLTDQDRLDLARAVSQIFARDPHDQSGSYQILLPQVSGALSFNAQHNVAQVSHGILSAIGGDFDGDKMRQLAQLIQDDNEYRSARAGSHFIGAGENVNVGAPAYEEYVIDFLSRSIRNTEPAHQALQAYAEGTLLSIKEAIRNRYDGYIERSVLESVLEEFDDAMTSGSPSARSTLLNGLGLKAGGPLDAFARGTAVKEGETVPRGELSNEWLWIDQLVRASLQEFQRVYVEFRPRTGGPSTKRVDYVERSANVKERRIRRSATHGMTMGNLLDGDALFRMFQKLHFTSLVSASTTAETSERERGKKLDIVELAELYEAMGKGITQSEIDSIRGKDEITSRAYAQLLRMATYTTEQLNEALGPDAQFSRVESLSVLASMQVDEMQVDERGVVQPETTGRKISLAQMILKAEIARDKRRNDKILEVSEDLQAKYARLERMLDPQSNAHGTGAEEAFIEIVGSQQLFTLLGNDSEIFGPQLTVEQWLRGYVAASEGKRKDMKYQLIDQHPAYLGRQETRNQPYGLSEVRDGKITSYRAVVDALLAVGNNRITMDSDGKMTGEWVKRNERVSDDIQTSYERMKEALIAYRTAGGRKKGDSERDVVARMLRQNPEVERYLMDLIPDSAVNAVFWSTEEGLKVSNWVYDMFLAKDAKEAEMILHRGVRLSQWSAMGVNPKSEGEDVKQKQREYGDLDLRFHRVMWDLAALDDGGVLYTEFMDKYTAAKDLDEFYKWMNQNPAIRGDQAPMLPWIDDTADFDRDKAKGGWASGGQGASHRDAISALARATTALVNDMSKETASFQDDVLVLDAAANGDQKTRDDIQRAIDYAAETMVGLGPQEIVSQITGAAWGFYSQAHDKGKSASNVALHGAFEAYRDAFGHLTNYSRMRSALTTTNIDDMRGHLDQVAKGEGRTMDHEGRTVEWEKPTVDQVIAWMRDPETRGYARAVLFPQVMERTPHNTLKQQMLVGHSLRDLLSGQSFNHLYPAGDKLSDDQSLRYLSMVAAQERKYGGHFDLQRWANELVIARLSGADATLDIEDVEAMTIQALRDIAKVLQATASHNAAHGKKGHDPLKEIKAKITAMRRDAVKIGRVSPVTQQLEDQLLENLVQAREEELAEDIRNLIASKPNPTLAETKEIKKVVDKMTGRLDDYRRWIEVLRNDDPTQHVVEMFAIHLDDNGDFKDPVGAEARKKWLVTYIDSQGDTFRTRGTAVTKALDKLKSQLSDETVTGNPDLRPEEWKQLSRAAITIYLEESLYSTGTQVSVPPFPDFDSKVGQQQARFFDTSFSYLLDKGFDKNSPVLRAATELHLRAGRYENPADETEIVDLIEQTLFKRDTLGDWTADISRASIEANTRLDSAAAGSAISMPGQSPKLEAVFSAAGQRSFRTQDLDQYMSTVTLTADDFEGRPFDEVDVTFPDGTVKSRPLAQLNNRFARSVKFVWTDAAGQVQEEDLLATHPNLGWPFNHPEAINTGLEAVSLARLDKAMKDQIEALRFFASAKTGKVVVEFIHPDTQPASTADEAAQWMNNLFFEGTSFQLNADRHDSLNSTVWFGNGSISPAAQAAALEASKKGKPALTVIPMPRRGLVKRLESRALTDLAWVLRMKSQLMFKTDLGFGDFDIEFYNGVYKDMKMRHFVRGIDANGETVLWTAEQVIAFQQANPGADLPFQDAELWVPSDPVLRSMLGEQGEQGVPHLFPEQIQADLTKVKPWRGVTAKMIEDFLPGVKGEKVKLTDTYVVHQMRQTELQVRGYLSKETKSKMQQRLEYHQALTEPITKARQRIGVKRKPGRGGFNIKDMMDNAVRAAGDALRAENIALDMTRFGAAYVGPRNPNDTYAAQVMVDNLRNIITSKKGNRTGWVLEEGTEAEPIKGYLSGQSLDNPGKDVEYHIMPGDMVVVLTDSFNGDLDLAKKRIDYLANRGAYIVLTGGKGGTSTRGELEAYLNDDLAYENLPGSRYVFQPMELDGRYQNVRARESTLMATEGIDPTHYSAILNLRGDPVAENAGWHNPRNKRLARVGLTLDLIQSDALFGYNVPTEETTRGKSQVERTIAGLEAMDTTEGRQFLMDQANGWIEKADERAKADAEFEKSWRRLMDRFAKNQGTVLPQVGDEFGTGDIIPLMNNHDQILLYRHGYKAPQREAGARNNKKQTRLSLNEMTSMELHRNQGAANIATFPTDPEPNATTHGGRVGRISPRSGHGLQMELLVDLQTTGGKYIAEWNGMKYVLTDLPYDIQLPDHGLLSKEWGIDIFGNYSDAISKESFGGMVDNHRMAFAVFGINFLPYVARHFGVEEDRARTILTAIKNQAQRISVSEAHAALSGRSVEYALRKAIHSVVDNEDNLADSAWVEDLNGESVDAQVTMATIVYLMTRGAELYHIERSGGFNDPSSETGRQSRLMPSLFTQFFDRAPQNSPLRKHMFQHFNDQLYNEHDDGSGYFLNQDWDLEVTSSPDANGKVSTTVGRLQFAELHSASENPVKNGQAFDSRLGQQFSRHTAAVGYQAIGADTAYTFDLAKVRAWAAGKGIERYDTEDSRDGGVWRTLTGIDLESRSRMDQYRQRSPGENGYTTLSRAAMATFRHEIDRDTEHGWDDDVMVARYENAARSVIQKLNLRESQVGVVDYWIRQRLGSPVGLDRDGVMHGTITASAAAEAAEAILKNVVAHDMPTIGGMVPMLHVHDLQMIHRENRGQTDGWNPRESMEDGAKHVASWSQWVKVAVGSVVLSKDIFDPLYLRATDGFFQTYHNATDSMLDLPVSLDKYTNELLLDPETNMRLVSLNPNIQYAKTRKLILDFEEAGLAELIGGVSVVAEAPAAENRKKLAYITRWRKDNNVPIPVKAGMRNYVANGDRFTSDASHSTTLIRSLIHLRVAMAMINPTLYVWMGPEQWARGALDRMANLATGESIAGTVNDKGEVTGVAGVLSRMSQKGIDSFNTRRADLEDRIAHAATDEEREELKDRLDRMPEESLLQRIGFSYRYTPQQMVKLSYLAQTMGDLPTFTRMVYSDLNFRRPHAEDIGKGESILAGAARFGYSMQDPTHGARATTLARRYLEGVLSHLNALPESHTLTPDLLVGQLATNPAWLRTNMPEAHKAGMNSIAQIRSLKQTVLNKMVRSIVDPLSESSHSGRYYFGNLVLKLPLLFSAYTFNVMTTITGMQGADQFIATYFHGRKKGLIGKFQARLRGEAFDPEKDTYFDLSDVMEGADLTRAFIRGGFTQAGLFQLGMMAGGLGLSGEDDETKKRRRLAEAQGAGFIYDIRAVENDFRNSDALFFDWLPWNLDMLFKPETSEDSRSMAEMHWTLKQFLSPIMGMEKFFETGDARQITWGFTDAFGSFPLINAITFDDMLSTGDEFARLADKEQELGEPTNLINAHAFLTNLVGTYERMLLENSFVNQLYVSADRYDRDPYALPLRNASRELQGDIEGVPRENDIALEQYRDPETGELKTGYTSRSDASGYLHSLTENRATLATLMSLPSLFTGMADSDYFRTNMVMKTREIELPEMPKHDVEVIVRALSAETGGQPNMTTDEIYSAMKTHYSDIGVFVDYGKLYAQAAVLAKRQPPAPMSVLDKDGREQVTTEGAKAILRGIAKGSVQIGDESLAGVYISRDMRIEIQKEWMKELVQEGMDMGLDQGKATSRMKRLWMGPFEDPSVMGLGDILWHKDISFSDTLEYAQLNTTYVIGPDGRPWATGYKRDGFLGAIGIKPLQPLMSSEQSATGSDRRLNTTDLIHNINTGLRGLELIDESRYIPTDVEIGKAIEDAIMEAANSDYTPYSPYKTTGGGYGGYGYGRYGYGGYGGGGGGGYSFGSRAGYYQKMYALPNGITPYGVDIPFINTTNPLIRRETVRRERIWSERGRLNQWQ